MHECQEPLLAANQMQRTKLLTQKKLVQQRKILAMMGIGQWVLPDSVTTSITQFETDILSTVNEQQPVVAFHSNQDDIGSYSTPNSNESSLQLSEAVGVVDTSESEDYHETDDVNSFEHEEQQSSIDEPIVSLLSLSTIASEINVDESHTSLNHTNDNAELTDIKVAPFDLQGARYGHWVLIVDIQALTNDSQKLWQNMTQALSLDCETSSFPICQGMDTAELANASLAGYVFKIAQSEAIKVVALTPLPSGLSHPNLTIAPTLDEMLADSRLKRQLWQQLSN